MHNAPNGTSRERAQHIGRAEAAAASGFVDERAGEPLACLGRLDQHGL
jgi:hypothetical protein